MRRSYDDRPFDEARPRSISKTLSQLPLVLEKATGHYKMAVAKAVRFYTLGTYWSIKEWPVFYGVTAKLPLNPQILHSGCTCTPRGNAAYKRGQQLIVDKFPALIVYVKSENVIANI